MITKKNSELELEIELLKLQLKLLQDKRYGSSSEKLDNQINQLSLFIEEKEIKNCSDKDSELGIIKKVQRENKDKPTRQQLPEHLAREDIRLSPNKECPECGGEEFRAISEDISESLEYVPASFKVVRYIRPRCVCKKCEKIVQAYPASKPIDKGIAGPGLLAHILVQKYCNHLPIYRQHQIYAREGINLSTSTMNSWTGKCVKLLTPLIDELKKEIFNSEYLHGDDTPIRVLAPGNGKTKTGRIWCYVRDGRPQGDNTPPAVCYYYSPDRKGERPKAHLKDFQGVLHADAYAGYKQLYNNQENPDGKITAAGCWAHARRKFYEVVVANDKANIALSVIKTISNIYDIESQIRGRPPDERYKYRQDKTKKIVNDLLRDLNNNYRDLPKKSVTARAIAYVLNNESALKSFLDDGAIEIDNNAAERAMRSIAIGRKNWLFAGSNFGGETAAGIYSLLETAKLNNVNPWKYLEKVLRLIQDHNHKKIHQLLPWNLPI